MIISKEAVLLVLAVIWGIYSVVVGIVAIISGYNNDLVWVSIIVAISGTTGAHAAISFSSKGLYFKTSNPTMPSTMDQEKLTSQNLQSK